MLNIQIVEDHKSVAKGLSGIINESGIVRVTGIYYNKQSCLEGLAKALPDILLLDVNLPDGNGVDFCAEITRKYPALKVIMLTGYKEFNIVKHALHNGALGYILKNVDPEEMLAGIETVSTGKQFLCEEIDVLLKIKRSKETIWLTDSEKDVLKHTANGLTRKEIALEIKRNEETIKTHLTNLRYKLGANNVAELVKKAYEMRLI